LIASFVADASIAISWAVESQSSADAARILEHMVEGTTMLVPPIWLYETANTLLILHRRGKTSKAEYRAGRELLEGLRILTDDESLQAVNMQVTDPAVATGLTVYDAAYLELAIRRQLPLASRDADLNRAAKRHGLHLLL
jgi:predicted nucleic acid-binding protein